MNNIKLIVIDVDGTLTDGKIYIDNNGVESKAFNVKDGLAIAQALRNKLEVIIMTGRESNIVEIRAKELGIKEIYQDIANKEEKMTDIIKLKGIEFTNVTFIGDDINDLSIMKKVGFSACPKDAARHVQEISDFISQYNGGEGAVRETIELILDKRGKWNDIVQSYINANQ